MRRFPLVRFLPLLFSFSLVGCLADTGQPIVEVRPRLVLAPGSVRIQAANFQAPNTGDMIVKWTRSISDTQLNFRGYYVKVWTSHDTDVAGDYVLDYSVRSAHVPKLVGTALDTSITFTGMPIGQYTVVVWGQKMTDTLGYSLDSTQAKLLFDPRPLQNPTDLRATSNSSNSISLEWTLSASDTFPSLIGYLVYFVDPDPSSGGIDSAKKHPVTFVARHVNKTPPITVPNLTVDQSANKLALEHQYLFWVKALRNDSTISYGADSNLITWAGAERVGMTGGSFDSTHAITHEDTGYIGYHHSLFFGTSNGKYSVVDDSNTSDEQVHITVNADNSVTLNATNGSMFLNGPNGARIDFIESLDSIFYDSPLADPSQFTVSSVTLPSSAASSAIVYLKFIDKIAPPTNPDEYARILIRKQNNGSYANGSRGLYIEASFQPGETKAGDKHLPYY